MISSFRVCPGKFLRSHFYFISLLNLDVSVGISDSVVQPPQLQIGRTGFSLTGFGEEVHIFDENTAGSLLKCTSGHTLLVGNDFLKSQSECIVWIGSDNPKELPQHTCANLLTCHKTCFLLQQARNGFI